MRKAYEQRTWTQRDGKPRKNTENEEKKKTLWNEKQEIVITVCVVFEHSAHCLPVLYVHIHINLPTNTVYYETTDEKRKQKNCRLMKILFLFIGHIWRSTIYT